MREQLGLPAVRQHVSACWENVMGSLLEVPVAEVTGTLGL